MDKCGGFLQGKKISDSKSFNTTFLQIFTPATDAETDNNELIADNIIILEVFYSVIIKDLFVIKIHVFT